jgi:hypothetical protein
MDWIEALKEPLTKGDIVYGAIGYLTYKWGMIAIEICKKIYKNVKYK